jgi:hypothetical protein
MNATLNSQTNTTIKNSFTLSRNVKLALTAAIACYISGGASAAATIESEASPSTLASSMNPDVALRVSQAEKMAMREGLSVVYYGSLDFKEKIGIKSIKNSEPSLENSKQVVIVESSVISNDAFFQELLEKGNFVISVGDDWVDSPMRAFADIGAKSELGDRTEKSLSDVQYLGRIAGQAGDGDVVYERATGYYYSHGESKSFHTLEQDQGAAIALAIQWARDIAMVENMAPSKSDDLFLKAGPTWSVKKTIDFNMAGTCQEKGDFTLRTTYEKLDNDGDSTKDYYNVKYWQEIVPGEILFANNKWRNADIYNWSRLKYVNSSFNLVDYDPTTSSGSSSASVDLSFSLNSVGISKSWSYSVGDVVISSFSQSSPAQEIVDWRHDINEDKLVGRTSYKISPGARFEVPNGTATPWNNIPFSHTAKFKKDGTGTVWTCHTWYLYPNKTTK